METFQHCRDKCLHSVLSDTTNLGVYRCQGNMGTPSFGDPGSPYFLKNGDPGSLFLGKYYYLDWTLDSGLDWTLDWTGFWTGFWTGLDSGLGC